MKHTGIMFAMLFYALSKLAAPELTDEDIAPLLERFRLYEQYTVYASDSMEVDYKTQDDSGLYYYKVTDETYDTWDEWTSFYESIFTEDYAAELMQTEDLYKNIDGYTYCMPGAMGWYLGRVISYEITAQNGDEAVVEIVRRNSLPSDVPPSGEIVPRDEAFTYYLRYTDDGWRIASPLPSYND